MSCIHCRKLLTNWLHWHGQIASSVKSPMQISGQFLRRQFKAAAEPPNRMMKCSRRRKKFSTWLIPTVDLSRTVKFRKLWVSYLCHYDNSLKQSHLLTFCSWNIEELYIYYSEKNIRLLYRRGRCQNLKSVFIRAVRHPMKIPTRTQKRKNLQWDHVRASSVNRDVK